METITMKFHEIKESSKVGGTCKLCGKKRVRTVSNSQTLNPFNRNKNGEPKNHMEIAFEIRAKISKEINILKKDFMCATCFSELSWQDRQKRTELEYGH